MTPLVHCGRYRHPYSSCRFWLFILVATVQLFWPRSAFADFYSSCEPSPFKGRVKTMIYIEGEVDPSTGAELRKPRTRYEARITPDGRTATEISSEADDARLVQLGMVPTTMREYDSSGRLIRQTLKMNGFTPYTTTTCEYDAKGRLVRAKTESKNPEQNCTLTYEYGPTWRSERFVTRVASNLTTIFADSSGRPLRETRFDQLNSREGSVTHYRQVPDGTEACTHYEDGHQYCRTSVHDAHGNVIEERSESGTLKTTYEYDEAGNWTKRVSPGFGPSSNNAVWRKFTYW